MTQPTFEGFATVEFPPGEKLVQLPEHGPCFVCGTQNPNGLGLVWYAQKDAILSQPHNAPVELYVFSQFSFSLGQQGPPKHAHGGASAAVIDEAMGAVVWVSKLKVLLANMKLDYRRPVPLNVPLRAEAWLANTQGRKAYTVGRLLLPDGQIAVEGTGLYVHSPRLFEPGNFMP